MSELQAGDVFVNEDGLEATVLENGNVEIEGEEVEVFESQEAAELAVSEEAPEQEAVTNEEGDTDEDEDEDDQPDESDVDDEESDVDDEDQPDESDVDDEELPPEAIDGVKPEGYVHPSLRNETYAGPVETEEVND